MQVLENGTRAIHSRKADPAARYLVDRGWLVEETFPAANERAKREKARRRQTVKEQTAVAKAPAFQALLRDLAGALKPREVAGGDAVKLWSYAAPGRAKDRARWIARVRDAGGSATIYEPTWEPALVVVAGPPALLSCTFWKWDEESLLTQFDDLDADAGLTFLSIEREGANFDIELARVPRRVAVHAAELSAIFITDAKEIAAALRARRWRYESDF